MKTQEPVDGVQVPLAKASAVRQSLHEGPQQLSVFSTQAVPAALE